MNEFKGTKGEFSVKEAAADGEILYYNVNVNEYNSIASFTINRYCETDLEKAKANAFLFSKAPEMLEMLKRIADGILRPREYETDEKIVRRLIKSATEL